MPPELVRFVQLLPEPSFLLSGEGEIVVANSAAGEMSGVEPRELAGVRVAALVYDVPSRFRNTCDCVPAAATSCPAA